MIQTIITFIIVLGFLVFIHELGHFLVSRWVKVRVLEFSIGFPPRLFSKKFGDTDYMLSWIPLGGYVRLLGQDTEDEDPNEPGNYASKSILQRFFILIAGSIMNILVAFIFMPLVFYIGYEVPAYLSNSPEIGAVTAGSYAEELGLKKNDRIVSVSGEETPTWKAVQDSVSRNIMSGVSLSVSRDNQILNVPMELEKLNQAKGIGWSAKSKPLVGRVSVGSPAEAAGLSEGDLLIAVNGISLKDWAELSPAIQKTGGGPVSLIVQRNGTQREQQLTPLWNEDSKYWYIGISRPVVRQSAGFSESLVLGSERVVFLAGQTFMFLSKLITGQAGTDTIGGPIMIASMVGQAAKRSVSDLMSLIAFISLQLGIFNLLPIPALDGGHILFLAFEKIKGSQLSKRFRSGMQRTGFSILMLIIIYISVQDGLRLFN